MAKKTDPSITYLNALGYNVVKVPRAGIEPLDLVGVDDVTQWLGPLGLVWTSDAPLPVPGPPRPATAVIGQRTDRLDLAFGLKILASALAAFGASVPSIDIAYRRARKIQFSFTNVTSTAVTPLEAGNYMADGRLNSNNPVVQHYLLEDEAEAFLILEVLKSDSITVTATDEHGDEVEGDVPSLQASLGATVQVSAENAGNSTLSYKGQAPVTFGFIVDRIGYDGVHWSLSGVAPAGDIASAAAPGVRPSMPVLLGAGCRVRI